MLQSNGNVLDDGQFADRNVETGDEADGDDENVLDGAVEDDDERLNLGEDSDKSGLDAVDGGQDRVNELGEFEGDSIAGVGAKDDGDLFRKGCEKVELSLEGDENSGELRDEDFDFVKGDGFGAELSNDGLDLDLDRSDEGTNGLDVAARDLGTTGADESLDLSLESGEVEVLLGPTAVNVFGDASEAETGTSGSNGANLDFTAGDLEAGPSKSADSDTEGFDSSTDTSDGTSDELGGITAGGGEGQGGKRKEGEGELHF